MSKVAAQREAELLRELLEEALLDRVRSPGRIRPRALAAVDEAVRAATALALAGVGDTDRLEKLDRAIRDGDGAGAAIRGWGGAFVRSAEAVKAATRALAERRGEVIDQRGAIEDEPTDPGAGGGGGARAEEAPFQAGVGEPVLHRITRAPIDLVRVIASAEVLAEIPDHRAAPGPGEILALAAELERSEGEDDDDAPAPREPPLREPLLGLRRLSRSALEQIGSLGELRSARAGERWTPALLGFEGRLLAAMDALAALGAPFENERDDGGWETLRLDIAREAIDHAGDAFTIDPMRAFASAFVLGNLEGDDAARAAVLALARSHRETHEAQAEALALAPSPALGPALARLALRGQPHVARTALGVLRARKEAPFGHCAVLLQHPDSGVRGAAARCLGLVPERGPAIAALTPLAESDPSPVVAAAATESLLLLDAPLGLEIARARLDAALAQGPLETGPWLRLVGIAGGADDCALLLRALGAGSAAAAPLGWLGHTGAVEPLLDALTRAEEQGDQALAEAADRALRRLLGELPTRAAGQEQAGATGEALAWRARWMTLSRELPERKKVRRGELFSPQASLDELARDDVPVEVREACALELGLLSGGEWVEVSGWITRQRRQLAALAARFAATGSALAPKLHAPGEWVADRLGRRRT